MLIQTALYLRMKISFKLNLIENKLSVGNTPIRFEPVTYLINPMDFNIMIIYLENVYKILYKGHRDNLVI